MRIAGLAYVAFLLISMTGMSLRNVPLQVAADATGLVLAVLLYRLFARDYPPVASTLLPLALTHYVIQAIGHVRDDTGVARLALVPFAPYLMVLGYLVVRSTFAPAALGALIIAAGFAWLVAAAPGTPTGARLVVILFGMIVEVALAISLLTATG